jgi:hypothetical protein
MQNETGHTAMDSIEIKKLSSLFFISFILVVQKKLKIF